MAANIQVISNRAGFHGTLGPLTSAVGFPTNLLSVHEAAEYYVEFSSGGTTEIVAGNRVTGATSAATAYVVSVALCNGTWAGGNAEGVIFLKDVSGTFQAENLDVGASSNLATIAGAVRACTYAGRKPLGALIQAQTAAVNFCVSGATPTLDAGTGLGLYLAANTSISISGYDDTKNFKVIENTGSSGAELRFVLFY